MTKTNYQWKKFSSEDKKTLRALRPIFIMAPRSISSARLTQLMKEYLPKANIVWGISEESYVEGFEGQPQFKMEPKKAVDPIVKKITAKLPNRRLITLTYPQHDVDNVVRKLKPQLVVVIRGSYQYVFHRRPLWHVLQELGIPYDLISPFVDEAEAKAYFEDIRQELAAHTITVQGSDEVAMLRLAAEVAKTSFDYSFQNGCVLAVAVNGAYYPSIAAYNAVLPYQTYALHFGNSREIHMSELNDGNYYDTIHAEMNVLTTALNEGKTFRDGVLFTPLLPCPSCARTLSQTGLSEVVYEIDHSDGYAVKLLEQCGIATRKITTKETTHD